ncbi:MAG: heavy metal translocating P-type ATPase [Bauldia litoralis]|uniref:heavy metal translocating P-type ATPase n=3 Tax=Bauldia litoralis TaxID=665467 RepID=UPI00329A5D29
MSAVDLSHYVTAGDDGACHLDLAVEGIHCAGCIGAIERRLSAIPGVTEARVNFTLRRVGIDWRQGAVEPATLVEALDKGGFRARPFATGAGEAESDAEMKRLLRALAVAGFAAMNIMLLSVSVWAGNLTDITPETRDLFHWLSALIALPAVAYAGRPFFASAWTALKARRTNMDVPISIGVLLALGVSLYETAISAEHAYFDSAIMLLFFLLAGRTLDQAMRRRTRTMAGNLAALKGETAELIQPDGSTRTVPAAAIHVGRSILVQPGQRIAADGSITAGTSSVDESLITGETAPRAVRLGDPVYAGTLNLAGALTVKATALSGESLVDEVQRLLDKATEARSRRVKLADRAARLYAPVVHLTALLAAIGWLVAGAGIHQAVLVATAVLIITCPCALALAIPAVQVAAAGALFRRGIFLNAGDALERLAEVDTIVFDKTGTLTTAEPHVVNAGAIPPEVLRTAARLALASRHPLARALAMDAHGEAPLADAREEAGRGIVATIDGMEARLGSAAFCDVPARTNADMDNEAASHLWFRHGDTVATFAIAQTLKADAEAVIAALKSRGFDCRILSGDRDAAVAPVAATLGIPYVAGMKPADKIAALQVLAAAGHRVAMIGDGLNDAPALAEAHVSLSPISALDITQAQADAVFLGERLGPVVEAFDIGRRARRLMNQNLGFSVVYNFAAVPLAIFGIVTPLIAALAMSGSSIAVTLNALRARPRLPVAKRDDGVASTLVREASAP